MIEIQITILIALTVGWLYQFQKNKKYKPIGFVLILVWLMVIFGSVSTSKLSEAPDTFWREHYVEALEENNIDEKYMEHTSYYTIESPEVTKAADQVIAQSDNTLEAIENAVRYVYEHVTYNSHESDNACFDSSASDVLKLGNGQCDTQSISTIAILRKIGIAARPVGGCIDKTTTCSLKFSMLQAAGVDLPAQPQFTEVDVDGDVFSRTGGMHAWVEAWHPTEGWITLEPTAGIIADQKCYEYIVELYPENNDKFHLCVSDDLTFAQMCAKR